jgi:tetratricopeptide (TPR) repeat protein
MKKLTVILLILALPLAGLFAANDRAGVTPLFQLGGGGRALGMGGANAALANDATAIFWNSAALTAMPERAVSFMHLSLPEGSNYEFAALGWPTVDYGTIAAAAFLITTDKIQRRDNTGKLLGEFTANQQMYMIGYGKSINRYVSLGLALKLFGHNIGDYSAFGAGGDLGLKLTVTDDIMLALNAQNIIAPKLTLDSDEETLPTNYKAGIGLTLPISSGRYRASVEIDMDKSEEIDPVLHVGGELALFDSYFLRGGYDVDQVSLGAGVRYRMVAIGYDYRTDDYFSAQHRLSLDISLGGSVESILAKRERDRRLAAEQLASEQRERDLRDATTQARYFFQNGIYDSAQVYYARVSALSGGSDKESSQRLAQIESQKSEELSDQIRANVMAEVDSTEAENLFTQAQTALDERDTDQANWLLGRLRPSYAQDPRFQTLEADYGSQISRQISDLQRQANRRLDEGDYASAAVLYDQALRLNPNDPRSKSEMKKLSDRMHTLRLLRQGVTAEESGDSAAARQSYEQILQINPDDSVAMELHRRVTAKPESVTSSSLADIQADKATWKLYLDGIEQFRQGNYQKAIGLWQQVLAAFPGNEETKKNIEQAKLRLHSNSTSD